MFVRVRSAEGRLFTWSCFEGGAACSAVPSQIDTQFEGAISSQMLQHHAKLGMDLERLFAERPVWSEEALQERVRSPKGFIDPEQLAKVAFLFRSGKPTRELKENPSSLMQSLWGFLAASDECFGADDLERSQC